MKSKYVLRHVITWLKCNIDQAENMDVTLLEDNTKLLDYIYKLKQEPDTKQGGSDDK